MWIVDVFNLDVNKDNHEMFKLNPSKLEYYRCEKEEDLAMVAAQQYYIEYNNDMNGERLMNLLPNYIPDYCLTGDKPVEYWHQLITQAFRKVCWTGNMLHVQIRTL